MNISRRSRHGKIKKEEDGSPMEVDELPQKAPRLLKPPRQKNGADASMAEGKILPGRRSRRNRGGSPVPSLVGECGAEEIKLAHRRRLILEDESEEEFVVHAIPAPKQVERKRTCKFPGTNDGRGRRESEAKPAQHLKSLAKKGRKGKEKMESSPTSMGGGLNPDGSSVPLQEAEGGGLIPVVGCGPLQNEEVGRKRQQEAQVGRGNRLGKARLEMGGGAALPAGGVRMAKAGGPAHSAGLEDAGPERTTR
ncbi:unnamed protein product [Linum trigynum]|uniref:Uncharacterized protein n=1 Tax=Linum trigynum TaxID=586398 RepID=A0AAV2FSF1_9ROSI